MIEHVNQGNLTFLSQIRRHSLVLTKFTAFTPHTLTRTPKIKNLARLFRARFPWCTPHLIRFLPQVFPTWAPVHENSAARLNSDANTAIKIDFKERVYTGMVCSHVTARITELTSEIRTLDVSEVERTEPRRKTNSIYRSALNLKLTQASRQKKFDSSRGRVLSARLICGLSLAKRPQGPAAASSSRSPFVNSSISARVSVIWWGNAIPLYLSNICRRFHLQLRVRNTHKEIFHLGNAVKEVEKWVLSGTDGDIINEV